MVEGGLLPAWHVSCVFFLYFYYSVQFPEGFLMFFYLFHLAGGVFGSWCMWAVLCGRGAPVSSRGCFVVGWGCAWFSTWNCPC